MTHRHVTWHLLPGRLLHLLAGFKVQVKILKSPFYNQFLRFISVASSLLRISIYIWFSGFKVQVEISKVESQEILKSQVSVDVDSTCIGKLTFKNFKIYLQAAFTVQFQKSWKVSSTFDVYSKFKWHKDFREFLEAVLRVLYTVHSSSTRAFEKFSKVSSPLTCTVSINCRADCWEFLRALWTPPTNAGRNSRKSALTFDMYSMAKTHKIPYRDRLHKRAL